MDASSEVWVLGGTGRFGRECARVLVRNGVDTVLVGRNRTRLEEVAADVGARRTVVAADAEAMAAAIGREHPGVVVNTVGPFTETASTIARACLPESSYVDLANDLDSASAVIGMHDEAVAAGRTLVTGAGFGVIGTEAPLRALCEGRPAPLRVRVDSIASYSTPPGRMGEALAATVVEAFSSRARIIRNGATAAAGLGSRAQRLRLPDGPVLATGAWPSGDLLSARRASGAPDIVAATNAVPTERPVRVLLPVMRALLGIPAVRRFAVRRLSGLQATSKPMPRDHTWARARAEWADGESAEAWLRAGDANDFTTAALAHTAIRILRGHARTGAGTPIEKIGTDLLADAGAQLV